MSLSATTTVSVLRGTARDAYEEYGDGVDTDEVIASQVPASILELPAIGGRRASGRAETPRRYTLRLWRVLELREDDRIRDEGTDELFYVTIAVKPRGHVGLASTRAELQRVT